MDLVFGSTCRIQLWVLVLRSTVTLKATTDSDTTLVSAGSNLKGIAAGCQCSSSPAACVTRNDNRGDSKCQVLWHCHRDTITVPRIHVVGLLKLDIGRDGDQDQALAPFSAATIKVTGLCKLRTHVRMTLFWGEAVLMMELPRRHSTPWGGGPVSV